MKRSNATRNLLLVLLVLAVPAASFAGVGFSITVAPPALPVYVQPPCPVDSYLWTPGYWAWGPAGYYWVPGVWVAPPAVGLLWTPGYWGFAGGVYAWHAGYWGPHVGFYGGVNYGFGYPGHGFYGGVWSAGHFRYNTAVVNVNRSVVHSVYVDRSGLNRNVVHSRVSFNGVGGVNARPTSGEMSAMREQHLAATHNQVAHQTAHQGAASYNHSRYASANRNGRQFGAAANHQTSAHPQANRTQHSAPHENRPALQARRESRGEAHAR